MVNEGRARGARDASARGEEDRATLLAAFGAFAGLAADLAPLALRNAGDPAHDVGHLCRVWRSAVRIAAVEGGDLEVLAAAALLHDCVAVEKDSPMRPLASAMAADEARGALASLGWPRDRAELVAHAVHAHSFSARVEPVTVEARVLQDADRLDAIGAVGIARCLMVSGRLNRRLCDPVDPAGASRPHDEDRNTLDHFYEKVLGLGDAMRTAEGRRMASARRERVAAFVHDLLEEVEGA